MKPIILIPARMAATRLPGKPLADIAGKPMIVRVLERALLSGISDIAVACDSEEIAGAVTDADGTAILTDPDLPSGSDRIWQALQKIDPQEKHDAILNLQGDMPTFDPAVIQKTLALLSDPSIDIATAAAAITDEKEKTDPAVVKTVIAGNRALYFSRSPVPYGDGPLYHHIGLYAYRRDALERFVSLSPSPLEKREKLEQLRALETGMTIGVAIVEAVPLGVDTPDALQKAREWYEQKK